MRNRRPARKGYVLIVVLMVVVVLSLAAYRFTDAMTSEYAVAVRSSEAARVKAFAVGGVHYAMGLLADPNSVANTLGNNPWDNPEAFSNVSVGTDAYRGGGRFSLVRIEEAGDAASSAERFSVKYGVTDEAGKINLNTLMRVDSSGEALRAMLILLPNMTEDVADAITDWLDGDEEQRASGAEAGAYSNYAPRNGPINSLDELLLVRGVTVANLYGSDRNRNGRQDANEATDGAAFDRGWSDYLTVYGHELNVASTGEPRVYVNDSNMSDVHAKLVTAVGQELADYIIAYKMFQTVSSSTAAPNPAQPTVPGTMADLRTAVQAQLASGRSRRNINTSMLSIANTRVTLPSPTPAQPRPPGSPPIPQTVVASPLSTPDGLKALMPTLLDKVTAKRNYELNPRINVNTCPATLLRVLPQVTEADVTNALSVRSTLDPTTAEYKTGAWLHTQGGMRLDVFRAIEAFITGYTQTYRVQAIGYFARGGPVARVEAVIDVNGGKPRIVYFRDLSELGGGFTPPR